MAHALDHAFVHSHSLPRNPTSPAPLEQYVQHISCMNLYASLGIAFVTAAIGMLYPAARYKYKFWPAGLLLPKCTPLQMKMHNQQIM